MRELRIGLIGAGWMGKVHSMSYRTAQSAFGPAPAVPVLAAIADIRPDIAERAARDFGYERAAKDYMGQGGIFINHSTTAMGGATQNVMFSHKQAGVGIGQSAVKWAKANGITKPVVALIGDLTEAQPKKRTKAALASS